MSKILELTKIDAVHFFFEIIYSVKSSTIYAMSGLWSTFARLKIVLEWSVQSVLYQWKS